jgi:hypothetical protein
MPYMLKLIRPCYVGSERRAVGDVVELDDQHMAQEMLASGKAEPTGETVHQAFVATLTDFVAGRREGPTWLPYRA